MHVGDFILGEDIVTFCTFHDLDGGIVASTSGAEFFVRSDSVQVPGTRQIPSSDITYDFDGITGLTQVVVRTAGLGSFFLPGGEFVVFGSPLASGEVRHRRQLARFTIRDSREEQAWFDGVFTETSPGEEFILERLAFDSPPAAGQWAGQFLVVRTGPMQGLAREIVTSAPGGSPSFGAITVAPPFPGALTSQAEVMIVSDY